MARRLVGGTTNIDIIRGSDHAVGKFIQITDRRYAGTPEDYQGEGYVLDHDAFGFTINLIGAVESDLNDDTKLIALTESFIKSRGLNQD
jgi:hypothetical protein